MSATVEKALQLIEAMARGGGPLGVSQLGRELKLNKSTVYRLVDTLVRHGYAEQDPATGRYALTVKMWEMGVGVVRGMGLRQAARPLLEAEAEATGEATLLGIVQDRDALIIDKVDSRQPLQIFSPLGARVSLCSSSLGRALLAFQPPEVVEAVAAGFAPVTPHGVQTRDALLAELARVRQEGCARSADEWQVGVAGVAAPIRGADGRVAGAFCITGPSSRLVPARLGELALRCAAAARRVSDLLDRRG
ncbi:IclR family transcriptional regulator [Falsiroseomonas sp. CW058]|uniref:IclR family transcriptional regulator n=1 Tax=Falsiroseomonas sp. CW058 TaxID=3388664 RepID=UPI003D311EDA